MSVTKFKLIAKSKRALIVFTLTALLAGTSGANSQSTAVVLPNRIFELSRDKFPKLVSDIQIEMTELKEISSTPEKLRRLRRCYELVSQIKHYRSAIQTINATVSNKVYDAVTAAETALDQSGVTSESVALLGIEAIKQGRWQGSSAAELENLEATSALFIGGVEDRTAAVRSNIVLADIFAALKQPTVSFDRFKDAVETVGSIANIQSKSQLEIELASKLAGLNDFRRFGLLSLLLKDSSSYRQQNIVVALAKNWTELTVVSDRFSPIQAVWEQRIDYMKVPPSDADFSIQLDRYSNLIDTSSVAVLLSGNMSGERRDVVQKAVKRYILQGRGLGALDLVSSLPADKVDAAVYVDLIAHFVDRNHWDLVEGLANRLQQIAIIFQRPLSASEQTQLALALATAGKTKTLKNFYFSGLLFKTTLQKSRMIAIASLNAALHTLGQQDVSVIPDLENTDPDLLLLASLIQNTEVVLQSGLSPPSQYDADMWIRAGQAFWNRNKQRKSLLAFMSSDAPIAIKLLLARGATSSNGFDASSEDGRQLSAVLKIDGIQHSLNEQPNIDEILVAASYGKKSDIAKLPAGIAGENEFVSEYHKRQSRYALSVAVEPNFALETNNIIEMTDYSKRVSAFRSLAMLKAYKLDNAKWLTGDASGKTEQPEKVSDVVVETTDSADISNNIVSIKNTNDNFFREPLKRPTMPDYYPSSSDVYSVLPIPFKGKSGVAIGGESRVDRLTRFASEHYDGVLNLGVREHLYNAVGGITPKFIFIRSGVTSMGELLQSVGHFNPELISEKDGNILLQAPLVVGPDATLVVSGEDFKQLRLSQQKSAFIINAGKIYFSDAEVIGYDEIKSAPARTFAGDTTIKFRPFVLSWSASQTYAANSKFEALGYSAGSAYGFSLSSGPADEILSAAKSAPPTGVIVDSSFDNLYYGFYAYEAENVKLVGNEYRDGVIYGLDPHDRSRHLLMAFNSAYGTYKKHGIIISREVDDSYILGNMSFGNAGTGIMLDRESVNTIVYANSLINNKGDGFAALESPCALLSRNYIRGNGRIGVKLRNSWNIHIDGNIVVKNGGSGIEAYTDRLEDAIGSEDRNFKLDPYSPIATFTVARNRLQENLTAIRTKGVAAATVFDNQFVKQAPKLFAGDAKDLALDILAKSSQHPITIMSKCIPKVPLRRQCTLINEGIILGQSASNYFTKSTITAEECLANDKTDAGFVTRKVN